MQPLSTGLHSTLVPIFADIIGLNCGARVLDRSGNRPTRGRARVATPWQLVLVNVIVGVVLSNALWWSLALDLFLWRYFLKKSNWFLFFLPVYMCQLSSGHVSLYLPLIVFSANSFGRRNRLESLLGELQRLPQALQ